MAGSYPDAPGRKMNTYSDGSILLRGTSLGGSPERATGVLVDDTGTAKHLQLLQHNETTDSSYGNTLGHPMGIIFIFPELRDIDGTYVKTVGNYDEASIIHSADTTSGLDGTWTSQSSVFATVTDQAGAIPGYREGIYEWTASAKRAVQLTVDGGGAVSFKGLTGFEVYGEIASGETPDRLLFIDDDTGLEYGVPQDWGNRPRGAAADKGVRIKNNSGTKQANTIDVSRGRTSTVEPDASGWYTMDNGSGYGASFQVTSLTAGSEDTWTLRQIIPTTAIPGLYETWIEYAVTSWT